MRRRQRGSFVSGHEERGVNNRAPIMQEYLSKGAYAEMWFSCYVEGSSLEKRNIGVQDEVKLFLAHASVDLSYSVPSPSSIQGVRHSSVGLSIGRLASRLS